jgi:hypothetical protein
VSLLGTLRFQRHYYYCPHCHRGFCPLDALLGLTAQNLSPAADQVVCLAGVLSSFAEAAEKVLRPMAGLQVAESTVERATEAAGLRVAAGWQAGQTWGPTKAWDWHKDAEGKTVAYVSVDATGVGQQGPQASKAEGRMANVAVIYNPVPEERARRAKPRGPRPVWQARYLATLHPLGALGEPLRRQGAQVGMDRAERWIALSDGGAGLEDFLRSQFGRVEEVILDFYHVAQHLHDFAKLWCPVDAEAAQALAREWCHHLKHEGGASMQAVLAGLDLRDRSGTVREAYRQLVGYFANQVHRMDYPRYRAKGWQIGSGPVESACKTVVGQRLKGPGMRWGEDGADALCQLRALLKSEGAQWTAFWNTSRN